MFIFRFIQILSENRISYSFLSITLSCKSFLYIISKILIVCWSFWNFFCLLFFCITILYSTLSLMFNPHAIPVDVGITINPIAVRDNVIELVIVAKITIVSIDFSIVVNNFFLSFSFFLFSFFFVLSFFFLSFFFRNFFFDLWFSSLK